MFSIIFIEWEKGDLKELSINKKKQSFFREVLLIAEVLLFDVLYEILIFPLIDIEEFELLLELSDPNFMFFMVSKSFLNPK